MKNLKNYYAPAIAIVEVTVENGIAASGGAPSPAPGQTGSVDYNQSEDHFSF